LSYPASASNHRTTIASRMANTARLRSTFKRCGGDTRTDVSGDVAILVRFAEASNALL
jgi:hypothetical protein